MPAAWQAFCGADLYRRSASTLQGPPPAAAQVRKVRPECDTARMGIAWPREQEKMAACGWSMLIGIATAGSVAAPLAFAATSCDTLGPCAPKACRLDADIAQANAKGQTPQPVSLEPAPAANVHC